MHVIGLMERTDTSLGDWAFILICVGVIVVVAGMGFVVVRTAKVRGSRWAEVILAGTVLWGVLLAGSVIFSYMEQSQWDKERQMQIDSGYFDPGDTSGKPAWRWGVWGMLMVGYGGLVVWARSGGRQQARSDAGDAGNG